MVSQEQSNRAKLDVFAQHLKGEVRSWLKSENLRQVGLAKILGVTPSAVSNNLHPGLPMSEGFIQMLSNSLPRFSDSYRQYLAIKSGDAVGGDLKAAAKKQKSQAQRISQIREAEKEVISAIRSFTEEAIKVIKQD